MNTSKGFRQEIDFVSKPHKESKYLHEYKSLIF